MFKRFLLRKEDAQRETFPIIDYKNRGIDMVKVEKIPDNKPIYDIMEEERKVVTIPKNTYIDQFNKLVAGTGVTCDELKTLLSSNEIREAFDLCKK